MVYKLKQKITNKGSKIYLKNISDWEIKNNVNLPDDYKNFLLKYNGGNPSLNTFNSKKGKIYQILSFFELSNILDEKYVDYDSYIPKYMYPIGNDSGGNLILISLEKDTYGNIIYWSHESSEIEIIENSFNNFFNILTVFKHELDFEEYCENNQIDKAIELVRKGLDINTKNESGLKLIQLVCFYHINKKHSMKLIKLLHEKGSNLENIIYWIGNIELIKFLLENAVDINEKKPTNGDTCLIKHVKDYITYIPLYIFLLENGADPELKNFDGKNALDYLVRNIEEYPNILEYKEIYEIIKSKKAI